MINKIYGFMSIIGIGFTLVAVILATKYQVYTDMTFGAIVLLFILLAIAVATITLLSKYGKIDIFKENTRPIIFGHLSMLSGVCALIISVMYHNGIEAQTALGIAGVLIVFMIVMLLFLLKLYNMMNDLVNESEITQTDDR